MRFASNPTTANLTGAKHQDTTVGPDGFSPPD